MRQILDDMSIFTGEDLKRLALSKSNFKRRFIVDNIYDFCTIKKDSIRYSSEVICGVTGIRGTGKTVALMHTISNLEDYDNTVYMSVDADITMDRLLEFFEAHSGYEYIFVDEITRVEDFADQAHKLSTRYALPGSRIIVSGTDSYVMNATIHDSLFHRLRLVRAGYISFEEQNYLTGISVEEYSKIGGILDRNAINGAREDSKNLMNTLVIDNIVNSILKNRKYFNKHWFIPEEYKNISSERLESEIRKTVFYIYYTIVLKDVSNVNYIKLGNYSDLKNLSGIDTSFLDYLGIQKNIDSELLESMLNILIDMDLISKVAQFNTKKDGLKDYRYYIKTPIISYRLHTHYMEFSGLSNNQYLELGKLFESVVMCELLNIMGECWFIVQDGGAYGNIEIDAVCKMENDSIVLIEAKSGKNFNRCCKNAKSLISYRDNYSDITDRLIIFMHDFEELERSKRYLIRSDIKENGISKLVEGEVGVVNLKNIRERLIDISDRNRNKYYEDEKETNNLDNTYFFIKPVENENK